MSYANETGTQSNERTQLRAVAELLGSLLLSEVDSPTLKRLRAPKLSGALAEFGVALPAANDEASWLEELAANYHDLFLRPETGPLVQSLWTQGRYEGDAAVRVRQLAALAGVEFQRGAARGAAPDHLGCLLLLWATTDGTAQLVADEIVSEHLEWANSPLQHIAATGGFYGAVASVALQLLEALAVCQPG